MVTSFDGHSGVAVYDDGVSHWISEQAQGEPLTPGAVVPEACPQPRERRLLSVERLTIS